MQQIVRRIFKNLRKGKGGKFRLREVFKMVYKEGGGEGEWGK